MRKSGPVIGSVAGVLLVVGGVAGAQAFQPVEHKPAPQPSVVQPVVEQPEPVATTMTATPTVAPKPAKKAAAPVESKTSAPAKKAPASTVKKVTVSEQPVTEPEPTGTATLRQPPPVIPGNGPQICGTTACTTQ